MCNTKEKKDMKRNFKEVSLKGNSLNIMKLNIVL